MNFEKLLTMRGFAPHGFCLLWDPLLIWLHVVSDAVIGLSYFSIPVVLALMLHRRRDIVFGWMVVLFAIFILACGTTHFLSILVLWQPYYGLEGLVKAITAVASVLTAVAMWPLLPKLIALPSPTQLQQANEDLRRESLERARMEEQLRQTQKLEAIGQLTGGIAHDFNNILTVIMGSVDRAKRRLGEPEQALVALDNAMSASERAASLTSQLLAFARKQALQVQTYDLNVIVRELSTLIDPTIGENVEIIIKLSDSPLFVSVDRGQLETALINLAVNARDAMPHGGTLTITTGAVDDDSAMVSVGDTGLGMDAQTVERATEPFFTTKPLGGGTGLGLSQVYGFAHQAGGSLAIVSQPGHGSEMTITLQRGRMLDGQGLVSGG